MSRDYGSVWLNSALLRSPASIHTLTHTVHCVYLYLIQTQHTHTHTEPVSLQGSLSPICYLNTEMLLKVQFTEIIDNNHEHSCLKDVCRLFFSNKPPCSLNNLR